MGKIRNPMAKGCAIVAAVFVGVPLLIVGVVGVQTWGPLSGAGKSLEELDRSLGQAADYCPTLSGEIPSERMELFLELRSGLVEACGDYGAVREGFESVASLDSKEPGDLSEVGGVFKDLGGASLRITPFLARFFEMRNEALLAGSMGLEEYSYIYALAYHDHLLSSQTRNEIFSDGDALSPEASFRLKVCLASQLEAIPDDGQFDLDRKTLEVELQKMEGDGIRLIWQEGLPAAVQQGLAPYRGRLDRLFCSATAGLEMERDSRRALRLALE